MENPAAAANERARRCFADRPVARASGRTRSFSPKELHAHLRKGVGVRDVREHEIGVLPAVHFGLFMRGRRRDPGDGSIFSALFLGSPMKLNSARMLEIMESSREYLAGELARRFDTSMVQINDMLCTLAEDGLVRMSSQSSRIVRLQRLSFAPRTIGTACIRHGYTRSCIHPTVRPPDAWRVSGLQGFAPARAQPRNARQTLTLSATWNLSSGITPGR
ncbi:hypothetical protein AB4Y43_14575 [Paraburkholderia sp. BR10872]|uniref:hypothetical protein n=1 Tax=Paraburkholderia sp. BR10872 TaxID=3236989 RepID=UPI0034D16C34